MDYLTEIAEKLARDALEQARACNDPDLVEDVAKSIGASSTTLQEAYQTAVRVLRAEQRARDLLTARNS